MVDINRGTSGIPLPAAVSQEIWAETQRQSVVQQLARGIQLPGGGLDIPIITGDPVAEWVSETGEKPVSKSTFGQKNIKGYTLAVIEPFSNQFRRDLPALYSACVSRLPLALAKTFDRTCLGFVASPGTGFDTLATAPTASIETDAYGGFLNALSSVVDEDADITAWALSGQGEVEALAAKDLQGRPLFIDSVTREGSVGQVLGRPVFKTPHAYNGATSTVGFGGDWGSAVWGYVEAINISISDQATLTVTGEQNPINLWQRNMFAVRAEFEVGFAVRDVNRFVRIVNDGS